MPILTIQWIACSLHKLCTRLGHDVVAVAEHVGVRRRDRLGEEPAEGLLAGAGQEPGEVGQVTPVGGECVGTSPFEERCQQLLDDPTTVRCR